MLLSIILIIICAIGLFDKNNNKLLKLINLLIIAMNVILLYTDFTGIRSKILDILLISSIIALICSFIVSKRLRKTRIK